ncbi:MAG: hypothetical protein INR73_20615 [Williamsia sp.]|nr:hypothetical protein [Williamsia sp.]
MRNLTIFLICIATCCFSETQAQGFLNKVKQKAQAAADAIADKKIDQATQSSGGGSNTNSNTSAPSGNTGNSRPSNNSGQGLVSTPPDVKENLTNAETSFKSGTYADTRYAIQQAMLGVELEIGKGILQSMPATIAGLNKNESADQVTSTGWGWAGLTIHREYQQGDKQFRMTVANNATWMQAINLYFNNAGYAQTSGGQQNWKQIKVKGYRSIIEFDKGSGYKISTPLGQTSLLVFEGVNFANEQEIMNAVNQIDIDAIKTQLGEK